MTRASAERLTKREEHKLLDAQNGRCNRCPRILAVRRDGEWAPVRDYIRDHTVPNALKKGKPDQLLCTDCDRPKTKRDNFELKKSARVRKKWQSPLTPSRIWPSPKLKSRGFQSPPEGYKPRWGKRPFSQRANPWR